VEASLREQMRWVFQMITRALVTGQISFRDDPQLYSLYFENHDIRDSVRLFAQEARLLVREDTQAIYFFCAQESPFTVKKTEFFKQVSFPSKRWPLFEVITACLFLRFFEENAEYVVLSEILERLQKLKEKARPESPDRSPKKQDAVAVRWMTDWEGLPEGFFRPNDWSVYKSDSQVGLIVKTVQVLKEQGLVAEYENQWTVIPTGKARAVYGMWREEGAWNALGLGDTEDA